MSDSVRFVYGIDIHNSGNGGHSKVQLEMGTDVIRINMP